MFIKQILLTLLIIGALISCTSSTNSLNNQTVIESETIPLPIPPDTTLISAALNFCDSLNFSKNLAFLINLSPHSGNYRFYAMNLNKRDTLLKGLVAHGHCKKYEGRFASFSNEIGSNCSSLGRFKVGGKYNGKFGLSYKLIGLDSSNNNAADRFIVLHSHPCIPNLPQEDDICMSEGCPTLSPDVFAKLQKLIEKETKPVLMWIYI